jgi:hypothetical protein
MDRACGNIKKAVVHSVLVGIPEGKRQLGKARRRWKNNIKVDLREIGWGTWTKLI